MHTLVLKLTQVVGSQRQQLPLVIHCIMVEHTHTSILLSTHTHTSASDTSGGMFDIFSLRCFIALPMLTDSGLHLERNLHTDRAKLTYLLHCYKSLPIIYCIQYESRTLFFTFCCISSKVKVIWSIWAQVLKVKLLTFPLDNWTPCYIILHHHCKMAVWKFVLSKICSE